MLEKLDLTQKLPKDQYKSLMSELELKLAVLQRQAIQLQIPILIVLEGWDAAGKGTLINRFILNLDPRHFTVYNILAPNEEAFFRPFLWRHWIKTPAKGRMAIFDNSWYTRVLADRVNNIIGPKEWTSAYYEINSFERQLTMDGDVIIKFFLHISKKEQKKRFKKLENNTATAWRVTKKDWRQNKQYDEHVVAIEEMLAKTDSGNAPWTIIEAHDRRFAAAKMFRIVIDRIESQIEEITQQQAAKKKAKKKQDATPTSTSTVLDKIDLSVALTREEYFKQLKKYQRRIMELEHEVYINRIPVIIIYEGWDAAGKGGNIKRLTQKMDPRGYEVIPIAGPNDIEKKHHYLWRFWNEIPKAGHIAIFDRTWYGRVLVERVEGFCTEAEWRRAYREINEFEEQLTNFGAVVVKFWLQISKDEQLRRFEERQKIPHKKWKITDEDWRNREKWDLYQEAVNEMLYRTSTTYAPWTIVESNSKHFARIKAIKTVIKAIEKKI